VTGAVTVELGEVAALISRSQSKGSSVDGRSRMRRDGSAGVAGTEPKIIVHEGDETMESPSVVVTWKFSTKRDSWGVIGAAGHHARPRERSMEKIREKTQIGTPHGQTTVSPPRPLAAAPPPVTPPTGGIQPTFALSFTPFGNTLAINQQNALERRKQE
jgi:hypothetical protein